MSLRTWNTVLERYQLRATVNLFGQLAEVIANNDSSSSSSSDSADGNSSSSSSSSSDDDEALLESLADIIVEETLRIYTPVEHSNIEFGLRPLIADKEDSWCISNTRFRQADLQHVANLLWPRILPFLPENSTKERLRLEYRFTAPYETCLLLLLCRLSTPRRLVADLEMEFGMRRSHLSASIKTFSAVNSTS